jgi:hypothetical protein
VPTGDLAGTAGASQPHWVAFTLWLVRGKEGYLLLVQLHMNRETVTLKNSSLEVLTVTLAVTGAAAAKVRF